jgi:hypothetical protein
MFADPPSRGDGAASAELACVNDYGEEKILARETHEWARKDPQVQEEQPTGVLNQFGIRIWNLEFPLRLAAMGLFVRREA